MTYYKKKSELIISRVSGVNKMLEHFKENLLNSIVKKKDLINNLYQNLEKNNYNIEKCNF